MWPQKDHGTKQQACSWTEKHSASRRKSAAENGVQTAYRTERWRAVPQDSSIELKKRKSPETKRCHSQSHTVETACVMLRWTFLKRMNSPMKRLMSTRMKGTMMATQAGMVSLRFG